MWPDFATWAKIKNLLPIFDGFLVFLQQSESTLAFFVIGQMFVVVNGQILNKSPYCHSATMSLFPE